MACISVYIIAGNEAKKIDAALNRVTRAEALVVPDSLSTYASVEVARRCTGRVLQVPFEVFGTWPDDVLFPLTGDWIFPNGSDEARIGVRQP